jgi:hypothetical protein
LSGDVKEVLEALGGHKRDPGSVSFQQCIGGDRGAVGKRGDARQGPNGPGDGMIRILWRGKDFPAVDTLFIQGDHVRKSSPNVCCDSHILKRTKKRDEVMQ